MEMKRTNPSLVPLSMSFARLPVNSSALRNRDTARMRTEIRDVANRIGRDGSFDRTF